jgi:hypothetical protein
MSKPGFSLVHCPTCTLPMRLLLVEASESGDDEMTYRCDGCDEQIKLRAPPKSLDWRG